MSDYPEIDYSTVARSMATEYSNEVFIKKQYENIIETLKAQRDALQNQLNDANARLSAIPNDEPISGEIVETDEPV
jgi:hypothetical protein